MRHLSMAERAQLFMFFNIMHVHSALSSFSTSQQTHCVSGTQVSMLMLSREIIVVYYKNHMNHKNTLCWRSTELCMSKQTIHAVTTGF
jgi:hypothetical protein